MAESKANGTLAAKDYPKAIADLRKAFPAASGVPRCGADGLRYGLCLNDVTSKPPDFKFINFQKQIRPEQKYSSNCFLLESPGVAKAFLLGLHSSPLNPWPF